MCPFISTIIFYIAKLKLPPNISVSQYCVLIDPNGWPYSCSTKSRILFMKNEPDKYNILEFEGKKRFNFSAFWFLQAADFSCSIELRE